MENMDAFLKAIGNGVLIFLQQEKGCYVEIDKEGRLSITAVEEEHKSAVRELIGQGGDGDGH